MVKGQTNSKGYLGKRYQSLKGDWCTVVQYENCRKVGVVFDGYTDVYWTRTENLRSGDLYNKDNPYNRKYFVGQRFYSKKWGVSYVEQLIDDSTALITFSGKHSCTIVAHLTNLAKGLTKNPMQPVVYGKGFMGIGEYDSSHKAYNTWCSMIERCYATSERTPTYKGTSVSEEWLNFQTFAKEYDELSEGVGFDDLQLDKDLFSGKKRGREYSKVNCCLLPHAINTALQTEELLGKTTGYPHGVSFNKQTGKYRAQISKYGRNTYVGQYNSVQDAKVAYLKEKSAYVLALADKYKNQLPSKTYLALLDKSKEILNDEH